MDLRNLYIINNFRLYVLSKTPNENIMPYYLGYSNDMEIVKDFIPVLGIEDDNFIALFGGYNELLLLSSYGHQILYDPSDESSIQLNIFNSNEVLYVKIFGSTCFVVDINYIIYLIDWSNKNNIKSFQVKPKSSQTHNYLEEIYRNTMHDEFWDFIQFGDLAINGNVIQIKFNAIVNNERRTYKDERNRKINESDMSEFGFVLPVKEINKIEYFGDHKIFNFGILDILVYESSIPGINIYNNRDLTPFENYKFELFNGSLICKQTTQKIILPNNKSIVDFKYDVDLDNNEKFLSEVFNPLAIGPILYFFLIDEDGYIYETHFDFFKISEIQKIKNQKIHVCQLPKIKKSCF